MKIRFFVIIAAILFVAAAPVHAVQPGDRAPAVSLKPLANVPDTGRVTLDDYVGMLVYLDFWASWCGPCRRSFPALEEIREKYHEEGFEVLAVNLDDDLADAHRFLERFPVSYPVVHDASKRSPQDYAVKGMPSAYLIDQFGVVRYVHVGFRNRDIPEIESKIEELLGIN